LIFTSTKPGTATFTIDIGHQQYTVTQAFTTSDANIRSVAAVATSQIADVSAATKTVSFKVVDRFGNGYAGVPVSLAVSRSNGSGSNSSDTSDENGLVSVDVSSSGSAGVDTVTATIDAQSGTQIGDAANPDYGIAASATSATSEIRWGALTNTVVAKVTGTAKVGSKLTVSNGTWTGATPTLTYSWYACSATSAAAAVTSAKCKVIAGATRSTYVLPKTQVGKFIRASVKATNSVTPDGITSFSATTVKVAPK